MAVHHRDGGLAYMCSCLRHTPRQVCKQVQVAERLQVYTYGHPTPELMLGHLNATCWWHLPDAYQVHT